jgi:hypothetical protein
MKNKRGQQDIIVTVLLVLIALGAVALVATFVVNNVKKTTQTAEGQIGSNVEALTNCTGVNLEMVSARKGSGTARFVITSKGGSVTASDVRIYVKGITCTNLVPVSGTSISPGETKQYNSTWDNINGCVKSNSVITPGTTKVEVAAVIGNTVCDVSPVSTYLLA